MDALTERIALAEQAGRALLIAGFRAVTAESCTGGGVAAALTDVPGSSKWFERGYITYSNGSKVEVLGVEPATLNRYGAVSPEVTLQMAQGALRASGADLALAVSGVAGPDGGTLEKPLGLVWFAVAQRSAAPREVHELFAGDRAAVRGAAVITALRLIAAAAAEF